MEKEIIIDGQGAVLGRISNFIAKKALQGNLVIVLNTEKIIIIGKPKNILEKYLEKLRLGHGVQKGPIILRKASEIVRRAIRGMIGRQKTKGREAFRRIKCYEGVPKKYSNSEKIKFEKKEALNFITIEKLSKIIRQK